MMTTDRSCAVVVPVYRTGLSDDERLSLRHLDHFLPEVEKILAIPEMLDFGRRGYRKACFPPAFFDSIAGYNQLLLSRRFYNRFKDYEFILIHQLDAIILSSDVERFLGMGVDYLGAPWIAYDAAGAPHLTGVGNGGLSLRRVSAFRRLLGSRARTTTPQEYYRRGYSEAPLGRRAIGLAKAGAKALGIRNSIRRTIRELRGYEDWFIAAEAQKYSPAFALGSVEQALAFAFEKEPRFCFEQAGGRMPFGAHAWGRYDRAFWEPYLLS
jgi:hypothetical protein